MEIVLPIPIDLLRPYLNSSQEGYGASMQEKSLQERRKKEKEAQRRYEEALGDVSREVSSEEIPTEMADGDASR